MTRPLVLEEIPDGIVYDGEQTAHYARCEWCQECPYHDAWLGLPAPRAFYTLAGEGLVVCEHCLPKVET